MNIIIYDGFVNVDASEFWKLLGNLNWFRDSYCGGEHYRLREDGKTVGTHVTEGDRYLINGQFFKKNEP